MGFRALMYAIVAFHFLAIGYLVVGGFIAWRWPKTIWTHLAMCAWGALIVILPSLVCPLTWSENWARQRAGLRPYTEGFIDRYIENVWYPARFTPYVQLLVAVIVATSWVLLAMRRRKAAVATVVRAGGVKAAGVKAGGVAEVVKAGGLEPAEVEPAERT